MQLIEPLMYIGPNRRSERTVIEWPLQFAGDELQAAGEAEAGGWRKLEAELATLGIEVTSGHDRDVLERQAGSEPLVVRVGWRMCALALALQRSAGHRVYFSNVLRGRDSRQCRLIFEYEHLGTGLDAGELALYLFSVTVPGLLWQLDGIAADADAQSLFRAFRAQARQFVLPPDAQAIIDAAARLDVPCVKLERDPYGGLEGDFRIRMNGLLKLGHSCHQRIVDGTLCLDRNANLVPLLFDREAVHQRMNGLGLPVPRQDPEFRHLISARRVIRAAERVGFPVVLKAAKRSRRYGTHGGPDLKPLFSAEEVRLAFEQVRSACPEVLVEQYVAGDTFSLLLAGHDLLCAIRKDGRVLPTDAVHASTRELAHKASQALDAGLLAVTLVTPDPGRRLADTGGAVVDLDPAPQLDSLLSGDAALMAEAAQRFVRWLYPQGTPSRIPLVAVTGTNGKTTTSKMISRIARRAGFVPGMASTTGFYIDEVLQKGGDLAGSDGHHHLLESREVNIGVLETARGGVLNSGFMFDACDVGVCLNVTEDHIGQYGIDTLEEMAEVKRSIVDRARHAVVLNADYPTCREMPPFRAGIEMYWTSVRLSPSEVGEQVGGSHFTCVLEGQGEAAGIVLYDREGARLTVVPVSAIPATVGGAALFNVSNAQHALCACHAMGIGFDAIRDGLSSFSASYEDTPGRLNLYREHPFTVIMDYVHNADGMLQLGDFIDRMETPGRKLVLLAGADHRTRREIVGFVQSSVGHFDHYFCHIDTEFEDQKPSVVLHWMEAALAKAGVSPEQVTIIPVGEDGAQATLRAARPGDLVLMIPKTNDLGFMWRQITSFTPEIRD